MNPTGSPAKVTGLRKAMNLPLKMMNELSLGGFNNYHPETAELGFVSKREPGRKAPGSTLKREARPLTRHGSHY